MFGKIGPTAYAFEPSQSGGREARGELGKLVRDPELSKAAAHQSEIPNVLRLERQRRAWRPKAFDGQIGSAINADRPLGIGFDAVEDDFE